MKTAKGLCDTEIARRYKVTVRCIEGIRKRFVEQGYSTVLYGKKRTVFKEKTFDGRVEAHLVALRCAEPPEKVTVPGHCSSWLTTWFV
jgi:hypothetical protein